LKGVTFVKSWDSNFLFPFNTNMELSTDLHSRRNYMARYSRWTWPQHEFVIFIIQSNL